MKRKEPHPANNNIEVMECETLENPKKIIRPDPIQKEQKYDRQLRLWGNDGQTALEEANICLINATSTGTETLKCLVLPGISKYFIVDCSNVTEADTSINFFVDSSSISKPRAQVACEMLQDLNPDSVGGWLKEDPAVLLENDPEFFSNFTVVICSRVGEHDLLKLSNHLWAHNIPMFIVDSTGLFGYMRLMVKEHAVIKAHPDNTLEDLRLDIPFSEFVEYCDNMDLARMDNLEHSHTPYLVILYKALKMWQQQTAQIWPRNYKEKCQIKDIVRSFVLKNEDGVPLPEENFEEALTNVNNAFSVTKVPSDVEEIVENQMANHPLKSEKNSRFWILVRALKEYINQNNLLPLRGSLPDMFSDSKRYINLQNIYKQKAENDIQEVTEFVKVALEDMQLPLDFISTEEIQTFCKNAAFLKVQYGLSYHDEVRQALAEHKIRETLEQFQDGGTDIYLAFRTLHCYLNTAHEQKPTCNLDLLTKIAEEVIKSCGLECEVPKNILEEILRGDLSEFHAMSAIVGGVCAQEVIKVLTRQFVPVNNVLVINNLNQQTISMTL